MKRLVPHRSVQYLADILNKGFEVAPQFDIYNYAIRCKTRVDCGERMKLLNGVNAER